MGAIIDELAEARQWVADLQVRPMARRRTAGNAVANGSGAAAFKPLTDADVAVSLTSKLMGHANLVRYGLASVTDGGSFAIAAGALAREAVRSAAAVSLVKAGLEGFARTAALDMPRGIRIDVVSPSWATESLDAIGRGPSGGLSAATVAKGYLASVEGKQTGAVLDPPHLPRCGFACDSESTARGGTPHA